MATTKYKVTVRPGGIIAPTETSGAVAVPVSPNDVKLTKGFWKRWFEANRTAGLPALYRQLDDHGTIENFRLASGKSKGEQKGPYFRDSDVYKWMEGAAWALSQAEDPWLESTLDTVIQEVAAAQREDGYINTFFTGEIADQRFRNLADEHELYCAGHMIQAAIAHHRVTGETSFLDVAVRFADFMVGHFGPGKIETPDGHPEVEMALIELYRTTGNKSYLHLAGYFLEVQGFGRNGQISGHAVRVAYLLSAAVDYYTETGNMEARQAAWDLWDDMETGRVYITGGIGARHGTEAVGERYELPNHSAYCETCAAIALGMWASRMFTATGDSRYTDMLERSFYNCFLSGCSLDTTHWFYVNPLGCFGEHQRQPWYGCTCCPTNAVRTFASIPGYFYSVASGRFYFNLYESSEVAATLPDGTPVGFRVKTRYPFDGKVDISVLNSGDYSLMLRIPGWADKASLRVNGKDVQVRASQGYLAVSRVWKENDRVQLVIEMPVEVMTCDARVLENVGRVALQRGPLVYCFESHDNPDVPIADLQLPEKPSLKPIKQRDMLEGIVILKGQGLAPASEDRGPLYQKLKGKRKPAVKKVSVTAIPYYSWANRGVSQMTVWTPIKR